MNARLKNEALICVYILYPVYIYIYISLYLCVCVCVCARVCVSMCEYVCIIYLLFSKIHLSNGEHFLSPFSK